MTMQPFYPQSWFGRRYAEQSDDPLLAIRHEMNRLFDTFGNYSGGQWPSGQWSGGTKPALDVRETEKELDIDADLPGFDDKDVEITLSGDVLTIHGERKNGHDRKNNEYYLSERDWGEFTRQVRLPFDADPKKVSARFDKGVLHIAVVKPEGASARAARIPVRPA
jgi:HSP20 family protein